MTKHESALIESMLQAWYDYCASGDNVIRAVIEFDQLLVNSLFDLLTELHEDDALTGFHYMVRFKKAPVIDSVSQKPVWWNWSSAKSCDLPKDLFAKLKASFADYRISDKDCKAYRSRFEAVRDLGQALKECKDEWSKI